MADDQSSNLVARWRAGDQTAAAELFQRYASRLIALARSRLSSRLAQRVDPEDVVQSAYRSFFGDAKDGRCDVGRGGDLWQLLVTITLHKLHDQVKRHRRAKRAVERELNVGSDESWLNVEAHLATQVPSPMEAVALADEVEQIMRDLKPLYRRIMELRLQGYNIDEIAAATQSGERTVRRVLDQVKQQLMQSQRPVE
jgi:RNA polymerase sigma-70 factor (ECF subfamily)